MIPNPTALTSLLAGKPRVCGDDPPHAEWITGMAGIKQNGILGWLLRGSWLTSSEYLV